jgi:hypothetical protein
MISKNKIYKIKRLFYYLYGEKFYKRFKYDWSDYPSRFEIIQKIINKKGFIDYLEIGCDQDMNFSKINVKNKTGVDPVSGGSIKLTSDDFFKNNNKIFDCIFIDGLHIYEQAKKDILNSVKFLVPNGVIILHDCLPNKIWNQIVPRLYGHWNGDVWKSIVESRTMKNIDTYTCKADHGLGIIINRPNRNILDIKIDNFKKLKFSDYYNNHKKYMNLIEVTELEKLI